MIRLHVQDICKKIGISQAEFRRKAQLSHSVAFDYWHDYVQRINRKDLNKICKVLNCTIADLIEYISDKD